MGYGVYVHVPFCVQKCNYCSFVSYPISTVGSETLCRYCTNVLRERELLQSDLAEGFSPLSASTVYIGGGTPTSLPGADLIRLTRGVLRQVNPSADAEISVEANPGTLTLSLLEALIENGVNRLSMGVQSFSEQALKSLGRIHSVEQALHAVNLAREAGFHNLSIDLIFGIPGQSLDDWKCTLETAISLGPEHISTYELSAEPGTKLDSWVREGAVRMPDEDLVVDMWELAHELLREAGYEHYEISNYAKPGFQCRHNLNYWRCGNYLGLGAAAHSHFDGIRWCNVDDPVEYCQKVERRSSPIAGLEQLSSTQRATEKFMLALRMAEGLDTQSLEDFGANLPDSWWAQVRLLEENGLLEVNGTRICPTPRGMLMNNVVSRMLAV
ncbi:MAG TPA: radical SAM family heme chaperone HemW [Firmicutes bacterium]|nr:radical SAM family heme chaperone HemW [Bacillota bacterium]